MSGEIVKPHLTDSAAENVKQILGDFNFEEIVSDIVNGRFSMQTSSLLNRLTRLFLGELKVAFALIGSIGALILICSFINNLHESFGKNSVSEATGFAIFVYIATVCAKMFENASAFVTDTLKDITLLVHSIIPSMSFLCMSGGETATAAFSHPVIFFVCSGASMIIKNIITPLVLIRAVCTLLCSVTGNNSLDEFTVLFAKAHKTILAFSMSIFAGILGISSFAATSFDNLAARGVKFAISASVPVVGGSISEAMSSVASGAALLKNAVGLGGVILIFGIFALPLLKLWALSLSLRLTAAFTAPVSEKRITKVLRELGDCIDMLFSSVACMGTIMIIATASIL